ncbi:MAG: DNA-processing protein DprA [Clostridia bacterium]|nr:DNA-processing protein DprA [Clostridia bacterium]
MSEKLALVWLTSRAPIGAALPYLLLKYFGSAVRVWEATEDELESAPVEWNGRMKPFLDKDLAFAERVVAYCEENSVGITAIGEHFYPKRLYDLASPPLLLYHVGNFCDLDNVPTVAVVGSRTPSAYGERAAKRLCLDLARGGAVLISGLARGIDGIAHRAALYAETFTVGVLGCGIDRAYPPEHADLIRSVAQKGLLITEYPPGTPPVGSHFPMRNRILAALSRATLVVEAAVSSGSLITAEQALRLSRALFAVPSTIFSESGAGSNHLLHCGAKCALRAQDVLSVLAADFPNSVSAQVAPKSVEKKKVRVKDAAFAFPGSGGVTPPKFEGKKEAEKPKKKVAKPARASVLDLSEDERDLLSRITFEPHSPEELAKNEMSVSAVLVLLTSLELKGYVRRVSGTRFCLVDEAE